MTAQAWGQHQGADDKAQYGQRQCFDHPPIRVHVVHRQSSRRADALTSIG